MTFVCVFQEIKDTVDGQRILEKKGSSAVSRQSSQEKEMSQGFPSLHFPESELK